MVDFLHTLTFWSEKILIAFNEFVDFASTPFIEYIDWSGGLVEIFDTYYWIFDIPNKLLASAFGLPPLYEMSLFELMIPGVTFICLYTLITWILDVI